MEDAADEEVDDEVDDDSEPFQERSGERQRRRKRSEKEGVSDEKYRCGCCGARGVGEGKGIRPRPAEERQERVLVARQ